MIREIVINDKVVSIDGNELRRASLTKVRDDLFILKNGRITMMSIQKTSEGLVISDGHRCVTASKPENFSRRKKVVEGNCLAPMPGVIIDVLVKQGDVVEEEQPLVVMESMKMQMQMRSSKAGRVASVLVEVGQNVKKGEELVSIVN